MVLRAKETSHNNCFWIILLEFNDTEKIYFDWVFEIILIKRVSALFYVAIVIAAERLADFYISVGNSFSGSFDPTSFTVCQYQAFQLCLGETRVFRCVGGIQGRYVAVHFPMSRSMWLSLCEVMVFEHVGKWLRLQENWGKYFFHQGIQNEMLVIISWMKITFTFLLLCFQSKQELVSSSHGAQHCWGNLTYWATHFLYLHVTRTIICWNVVITVDSCQSA